MARTAGAVGPGVPATVRSTRRRLLLLPAAGARQEIRPGAESTPGVSGWSLLWGLAAIVVGLAVAAGAFAAVGRRARTQDGAT